ncbi:MULTISPECIES: Cu(I)-responsive transcriptional regulator [unclassified Sulfitobacter]|jgi:MerR family transcriptional regulator, copper efflux regulator|uniref:Cu(I)-responsive transcriptional regulator n=1 Tax=unclassified Sulfitobacter TaxID=196795 RepID=UPI0007C39370|nr:MULTISPECIES: Cu(I)-responsive transcriptional regulator [unclassified Sulfitobacter]MAM25725.1 Cu(I)-responsive transcriptional regulator [Paracoccaceae bacterium]KZY06021.1 Cu(I)-responsive transcriptional regulator [Sulfitobacter sp. HI0023]KZY27587.1 Cu(I)-responsive transcriptional regulator [Sulfitobacter sp. HI0040]KZZ65070.1 Cu(I)-responsive transcriptional regulator [Sulfitobacter sp. HI0129]MBO29438.1 Cu(I)-responsive transcriptional regulator [Paracoccaceae bacterium]
MNIGEVAERAGLPPKTIRYYEDIGLIRPMRSANGYREFRDRDLHKLAFLGRARALGFSIEDCRTLLALYEDTERESAQVKQVAQEHLVQIDAKIAQLESMRATLAHLIEECRGDHRPDCPILEDLSAALQ